MKFILEAGLTLSLFLSPIQADVFSGTVLVRDLSYIDVVAHRGASGYAPENTFAAFDKAVQMGADYIELDVHRSKDGELVVIHDSTVDRTTDGSGKVGELTVEELNALDAGSWMEMRLPAKQSRLLTRFSIVITEKSDC